MGWSLLVLLLLFWRLDLGDWHNGEGEVFSTVLGVGFGGIKLDSGVFICDFGLQVWRFSDSRRRWNWTAMELRRTGVSEAHSVRVRCLGFGALKEES